MRIKFRGSLYSGSISVLEAKSETPLGFILNCFDHWKLVDIAFNVLEVGKGLEEEAKTAAIAYWF